MKVKALSIGVILLLCVSCISTKVIRERTRYFARFSADQIWQASLDALKELNFTIMEKQEWRGFIFAERRKSPYSTLRLPAQMSIRIGEEEGLLKVDCEAILVGEKADYPAESRRIKNQFFTALKKRLKELRRKD